MRKYALSIALFLFGFQILTSANIPQTEGISLVYPSNIIGHGFLSENYDLPTTRLQTFYSYKSEAPSFKSLQLGSTAELGPVILCPTPASSYNTNPGECFKSLSFEATTVLPASIQYFVGTTEIVFPYDFPTGTTTVEVIATDLTGPSTCYFDVTVVNNDTPVVVRSCPPSIDTNVDPGQCEAVVTFNEPIVNGLCESDIEFLYRSGDSFPIGSTRVTFSSPRYSIGCWFRINVYDNEPPLITCPTPNSVYNVDPGTNQALLSFNATATNTNCAVDSPKIEAVSLTYEIDGAAITFPYNFPVGNTTVSVIATESGLYSTGASSTCTFQVNVVDNEPPAISCPSNITASTDLNACTANINFSATANDNAGSTTITYTLGASTISSPYNFPIGTSTITATAEDSSGLTNSCDFIVTVTDDQKPTLSCPSDKNVSFNASCGYILQDYTTEIVANDNCDNTLTITQSPAAGTTISAATTVTITATDDHGNSENCQFQVIPEDTTNPVINCLADQNINTDNNQCFARRTFNPVVTDNCTSSPIITYTIAGNPISFPYDFTVGSTTVNVRAEDNSGNVSTCSFEVNVTDNQVPVVVRNCPEDIVVSTDPGQCEAVVSWLEPIVDENCTFTYTRTHAPGDTFPIGRTRVQYIMSYNKGNLSCSFFVNVVDNEAPVLNCPVPASSYGTDPGNCDRVLSFTATADDNCSTNVPVSYQIAGNPITFPYTFPTGTTTVTAMATDSSGNTGSCDFDVTIEDTEKPVAPSLSDITWGCAYTVSTPTASDNCSGTITGTTTDPLTYNSNGTYTVTWTFDDGNGNVSTAAQNVTIQQIECNTNVVQDVSCNGGTDGQATVNVSGGVAPITIDWGSANPNALAAGTYTVEVTDANGCKSSCDVTIAQPAVLTANATQNQGVLCNGQANGQATVVASGGNGAYTYAWDSGASSATATNLNAGLHSVTVTDSKGCAVTTTVTISQPNTLAVSLNSKTNTSCNAGNDGRIDVRITGGTPSYSYSWTGPSGYSASSQDITGLRAGSYSLTVTDSNGCQRSFSTTITQPTSLSLNLTKTDITCNGETDGTATAIVSGGTSPYSYSWNSSPTQSGATAYNLPSGSRSVTVTDANGCTISGSISISEPTSLTASGTFTPPSCFAGNNGTASVTASGGTAPYSYQWSVAAGSATSASVSGLSAGFYSVTVTDARGCNRQVGITVTQPTAVSGTTSGTLGCAGSNNGTATVSPTGGTAPYTYLWSNGSNAQTISGLSAGTYSVVITDSNGCKSNSISITNANPSALTITASGNNTSSIGGSNGSASSTASGGDLPYSYSWSNGATSRNITGLSAGTYTVTVTDRSGCTATASVNIGDPMNIDLSLSSSCEGIDDIETLSAVPIITGGFAPYSYTWSFGNFAITPPGNYSGPQSVKYTAAGDKVVVLTITDSSGQTKTVSQTYALEICYEDFSNCSKCTSNDFIIGDFYIGDENGNRIEDCTGGETIAIYVWFTTPSSARPKYNLYFIAGYTVFNPVTGLNTTDFVEDCLYPGEAIPVSSQGRLLLDDDFVCGSSITLSNIRYSWKQQQNSDCGLDTPKCRCINNSSTVAAPLSVIINPTNVLCFGDANGTASSQAYGGKAPYTYTWNNGNTNKDRTNLSPGTYTVTVRDSEGRVATATTTITQPALLTASAAVSSNFNGRDISCFNAADGQATVSVSGGTTPYTYSWSDGQNGTTATGLSEGNYQIIVTDANGCSANATVTLTDPDQITTNLSSTNPLCFGDSNGTASISVTGGGTAPFTYAWSNGQTSANATGLSANTNYTVVVTDVNGCTASNSVTLTQPAALQLSTSRTNVDCNGGSTGTATVTASGGTAPYTYLWNNGQTSATASGLTAGSYQVTVTDSHNCKEIASVIINQPTALSANASSTDVSCFGGSNGSVSVSAFNGSPGYSYSWNTNPVQTTRTATGLPIGTYTVTVTDNKGCTTTASATVSQPTSLTATTSQTNVSCFGVNDGSASISVSGGSGGYSYTWNTTPVQRTATASGLAAGNYTVSVTDSNGCILTESFSISQPNDISTPNAGQDQNLSCGIESTNLNANVPVNGTGLWSIVASPSGGNGVISNTAAHNATFTASVVGNYTLRWTISSGSCAPKSDDVIVSISRCSTLDFDGVDDHITFGNNYNFNGSFSFGIWVKPNVQSGNIQTIFSKRNASNLSTGYDLRIVSNIVSFRFNNGNLSSPYPINTNRWFHLAVTFNGSNYKLYIDGIEMKNVNGNRPASNTNDFIVGGMDQTSTAPFKPINYFAGWLDELRIWNTPLTVDQIRHTMNQEIQQNGTGVRGAIVPLDIPGASWNNLIGYYKMNQGSDVVGGNLVGNTLSSVPGKLRNISTWQEESAPIPYYTNRNGSWTNRSAANTPWRYGSTVWDYPNSTGIDGTPINWNIAITNHNISSGNKDIVLYALLQNAGELTMADPGTTQNEKNDGQSLRLTHYYKLDGTLDLLGESQLLQDEGSLLALDSEGTLERDQQGTSNLFNYNYFSSPVSTSNNSTINNGYTIGGILKDGTNSANPRDISFISSYNASGANNPITISKRWLYAYENFPENNYASWNYKAETGSIATGLGFTMKGSGTPTTEQNYVFVGKPHNGTIQVPISAGNEALVGNPYPSSIDAYDFIKDNIPTSVSSNPGTSGSIDGTLYFWEHFSSNTTHVLKEYEGGYSALNLTGSVTTIIPDGISGVGASTKTPGRYIPVGQGFYVNASNTGGQVRFKNSQRIFEKEGSASSVFMRTERPMDKPITNAIDETKRIKLNFKSPNHNTRQLLIGFTDNQATDGFDYGYDAIDFETRTDEFSWMIGEDQYVIQGVGRFNTDKQYPVGIFLSENGQIEVEVESTENFSKPINIYVFDALLETYTNIKDEAYITNLEAGDYTDRFYIVFKDHSQKEVAEELPEPEHEFSIRYLDNSDEIFIQTPQDLTIHQVDLYNISGQVVKSWNDSNANFSTSTRIPINNVSEGHYIIKVYTQTDTFNKKIIIKY